MTSAEGGVDYDADVLRGVAVTLNAYGEKYLALSERADKAADEARTDAATFKPPYDPAPVYDTTIDALGTASGKYRDETKKLGDALITQSGVISRLADELETGENEAARRARESDPNGPGPGNPPTSYA